MSQRKKLQDRQDTCAKRAWQDRQDAGKPRTPESIFFYPAHPATRAARVYPAHPVASFFGLPPLPYA
jgi:hypothetical protein